MRPDNHEMNAMRAAISRQQIKVQIQAHDAGSLRLTGFSPGRLIWLHILAMKSHENLETHVHKSKRLWFLGLMFPFGRLRGGLVCFGASLQSGAVGC